MKHKWLAAILCCTLTLFLASCGNDAPSESTAIPMSATDEIVSDTNIAITPINLQPQKSDYYPFIGMTLTLPERLREAVLQNSIFMTNNESADYAEISGNPEKVDWLAVNANSTLHSSHFDWRYVPSSIRDKTPTLESKEPLNGKDYEQWLKNTEPIARLSIYNKKEFNESMLEEEAFSHHQKLGENEKYVFILHTNDAPKTLEKESHALFEGFHSLKNHIQLQAPKTMDKTFTGYLIPVAKTLAAVGDFKAQTLDGKPIDASIFSKNKLTMVNVWTTWCTACVKELPTLEKLSNEFKTEGLQIVSVVADTATKKDGLNKEQLALAKKIQKKSGITFPSIVPDEILLDGILANLTAYPITYFVDSKGNIVGDPVPGALSEEDWRKLMTDRLEEVGR